MASSSASGGYGITSSSSEAAQAALLAEVFTIKCETGFVVAGIQNGEAECTPIRVFCTLVTISVVSGWFSRRQSIKKLLLFFSHWLSGLVHLLALMVEASMILVCWTGENVEGLLEALKYIEMASANMFAITNLAICVNLSLIIMSYRTLSTVKAASSSVLILVSFVISAGAAVASVPFWDTIVLIGTTAWPVNDSERASDWISISMFYIEFIVGVSMLLIVTWLLLFWTKEIKGCWRVHARIRYYFGLTLIGTAVNLALGICGILYIAGGRTDGIYIVLTWTFRYIHIALDSFVLYGVLGARTMDESISSTSISGERPIVRVAGSRDSASIPKSGRKITSNQDASFQHGHDESDRKDLAPINSVDKYSTPPPTAHNA